jgi:hypothetical protein
VLAVLHFNFLCAFRMACNDDHCESAVAEPADARVMHEHAQSQHTDSETNHHHGCPIRDENRSDCCSSFIGLLPSAVQSLGVPNHSPALPLAAIVDSTLLRGPSHRADFLKNHSPPGESPPEPFLSRSTSPRAPPIAA